METSEDLMWKHLYTNIKKQSVKRKNDENISDRENVLRQMDGSFFEKFGELANEYNTENQEDDEAKSSDSPELSGIALTSRFGMPDEPTEVPQCLDIETNGETNKQSAEIPADNVSIEALVDSETDEDNKTDLINNSLGWNIDELYSELLYEIIHNIGDLDVDQTSLFSYLQDAFKMTAEKHDGLLDAATNKEKPKILLNVEVVEAKDLLPKDANGLSDPFVTLYLESTTTHRFNTSVKSATLNPVWEEHFSLPIPENAKEDRLCLEVWDFDPAETVREKMSKILEVRGIRGLRKLIKEIAITASTGQHNNEFVGHAHIPLKTIPAAGMTMWYSLDKKNKLRRRGVLKLNLAFSTHKQKRVAAQEHRHLLKMILLHELESNKTCVYSWCGEFSRQAEALLTQHSVQSGLGPLDVSLARWTVFATIHSDHPLSLTIFSILLAKISQPLQTNKVDEEDIKFFWKATKKILPSCFSIIRKIHRKSKSENLLKQVREVLNIFEKLSLLEVPEDVDLFPTDMYPWLTQPDETSSNDIKSTLGDAIILGANEWFDHLLDNNQCSDDTDEGKMQHMIKIVQLIRADLQIAIETYDILFLEIVNFQYARTLYTLYEQKLTTFAQPKIERICKSLKRVNFDRDSMHSESVADDFLAQGTTLFELYLVLQKFVVLGVGLFPSNSDSFHIGKFYEWFYGGVAQWLDIAVFKALQRIEKAVELDSLVPVSSEVKYSSSAVDTLTIFYQIRVFWQQLNWPDVEGCYTFVAKIIDDICRCSVFFADKMSERLDGMGNIENVYEKKFEVTQEWCLAINNIDYVRQSLQPFVSELGMKDILNKLSDLRGPSDAERCKQTLQNVIENAIDTVKMKIIDLLETVCRKMSPAMTRLLVEGAELYQQDSNSIDKVMRYLDGNLATMHEYLNNDNFMRFLEVVWENVANILHELVQTNLEKRRPPSFFSNLHETLKAMLLSFNQCETPVNCPELDIVEKLLYINGLETSELIHQFHLERWEEQKKLGPESPYGQLTVRCLFNGSVLKIEIMNARNLVAMDTNGSCDSFVRVHLLPEDYFAGIVKPKTQTHTKTQFPLYDETFTIILTPEQRSYKNGLIMFSIKDKDFLSNQYIAEAFIHFDDVPDTPESLQTLPQVHLILSRPTKLDTETVKILENRQGDKQAKEFLKRIKQKIRP